MAELDVRKISNSITQLHLERKIKVFISSICGQKKYDTLRKEILVRISWVSNIERGWISLIFSGKNFGDSSRSVSSPTFSLVINIVPDDV